MAGMSMRADARRRSINDEPGGRRRRPAVEAAGSGNVEAAGSGNVEVAGPFAVGLAEPRQIAQEPA